MSEESKSKALNAIYDKALKLLKHDLPDQVQKGLELFLALARYKHDVRSDLEKTSD